MSAIFKSLFEWVVEQYVLFENPIHNWIAFFVIGAIGFTVAWNFVGNLYRDGSINGSTIGSLIHWIVRLIVVTVLYLVIAFVIWVIKLILAIPWWGWIIFIILLTAITVFIILNKRNRNRINNIKAEESEK